MTRIDTIHCSGRLETGLYRTGIRESCRTTDSLVNSLMTCFTGKPLAGQTPLVRFSPRWRFWLSVGFLILIPFLTMLVGKLGIIAAIMAGYVGAVVQTGLFRILQVQFGHHASHKAFMRGGGKKNEFYLNLATIIAFCRNGKKYRLGHKAHHSRKIFTTIKDPDAALPYRFGIRPGIDRIWLFRCYLHLLIPPRFHVFCFWNRVKSNFVTRESVPWRILPAWLAALCGSFAVLPV